MAQAVLVHATADANELPTEPTTAAQRRSTRTVQAAGWLEAEPFFVAATALADGVVEEILVLEGDFVEKGQVLARMVDDDAKLRLAGAEAELARARASLDEARARLTAAQRNWDEPYELRRAVASGQASLEERRAELAQLPALVRAQDAVVVQAREELKSIEEAYKNDAASEIEFITAREEARAREARLEALRAREPILQAAVTRLESDVRAAKRALELRIDDRARLDAAAAVVSLSEAQVTHRQALRDEAALEVARMTITAPISGYVQRRLKAPGDKVVRMMDDPNSAHIAHLYDPERLQVRVDVPLADASQVFVGQRCEVIVEVLPDETFEGEVLRVTHEADLQKNTLQVKVKVIDPDPVLRPEMLTRVKFLADGEAKGGAAQAEEMTGAVVRVPEAAVEPVGSAGRVWLITERANGRGVLRPVPVTRIEADRQWVTVSGALQPGAMIAADPAGCRPGERVRLRTQKGGAS